MPLTLLKCSILCLLDHFRINYIVAGVQNVCPFQISGSGLGV
jgi:hypothetical protein